MSEKATADNIAVLRRGSKRKNPRFKRHENWRYKRLSENWRRPRGLDNKMRLSVKGWPKSAKVGYGGPRKTRGLHPSGYREVLVHTPDEAREADPSFQALRIAHTVGTRKRIQIASIARERGIHVVNPLVRREIEEEEMITEEEMPDEAISESAEMSESAELPKSESSESVNSK